MGGDPWEPKGSHGRGPLGGKAMLWEGTHGIPWEPMIPHGGPWVPMGPHGDPMEYHGIISFFPFLLSMDFPWIFHGIFHGLSMDFQWIFHHGLSMDFPSMDYPCFLHELQNVSVVVAGTPLGVKTQTRPRHLLCCLHNCLLHCKRCTNPVALPTLWR